MRHAATALLSGLAFGAVLVTGAVLTVETLKAGKARRAREAAAGLRAVEYHRCHWPYFVDDGERCHINWQWQERGALNINGNTTLGDAHSDTVQLNAIVPLVHEVHTADTLTIGNGRHTVLLYGPVPYSSIQAPNAFRDGVKCYSLNVLHVDGTRVPVACPK